jgi:hypothetical protein
MGKQQYQFQIPCGHRFAAVIKAAISLYQIHEANSESGSIASNFVERTLHSISMTWLICGATGFQIIDF